MGGTEIALPARFTSPTQVSEILADRHGRNRWDDPDWYPVHHHLVPDPSNPNNQYRVHLDAPIHGPLWIHSMERADFLTADAQTTFVDRKLLVANAAMLLCESMMLRAASEEGAQWRRMFAHIKKNYALGTLAEPMPEVQLSSSKRNW